MLATLPAGFEADLLAGGLYEPTAMDVAPDGRIFVTEKPFDVRVVQNDQLLPTPFITLPVERSGERGVDGIVLDPDFEHNGYVYVYYTRLQGTNAFDRLSRFTVSANDPNVADPNSERVLIDGIPTVSPGYHNGAMLHFGADGMLYVGVGDTMNTSLPQDLTKLQGKILRINPGAYPNIIPSDNPFVGIPGDRPEIWARGLRNPFTGSFVPGTNRLFVDDVGSDLFEEIDEVTRGGNYGWPVAEGFSDDPDFVNPLFAYPHDNGQGAAIAGGAFYTGSVFPPSYQGQYFFSDYVRGFVRTFNPATHTASDFATDFVAPVDIDNSPDGNLYVLSLGPGSDTNGAIYEVHWVGGNRAPTVVATANPLAGPTPLTVNFDASASTDPDGDPMTFSWDFGDGQAGNGVTTSHTYTARGTYTATVTVNDGQVSKQSQPLTITVGNSLPIPTISLPTIDTTYRAGDTINFSGSATDPDDGPLPDGALEWKVVFHHEAHTHPFIESIPGVSSGSFQIPLIGEVDPVQWYRISLTATDSGGLKQTTFVDVHPVTSSFTLASNIDGATLLLDDQPTASGTNTTGVVNMTRTIGAPPMQLIGGWMYRFVGWSDGGGVSHSISTPDTPTTYVAQYQPLQLAATYASHAPSHAKAGKMLVYQVTVTNVGTQTWRAAGHNRVQLGVYFGHASDAVGAWTKMPIRFSLPHAVAPGASVTFKVRVTAPTHRGAFVLRERMVKGNSSWFGTMNRVGITIS